MKELQASGRPSHRRALSSLHKLLPIFLPPFPYPGLAIQISRPGTQTPPASAFKCWDHRHRPHSSYLLYFADPSLETSLSSLPSSHPAPGSTYPRGHLESQSSLKSFTPSLSFHGVSLLPPSLLQGWTWLSPGLFLMYGEGTKTRYILGKASNGLGTGPRRGCGFGS